MSCFTFTFKKLKMSGQLNIIYFNSNIKIKKNMMHCPSCSFNIVSDQCYFPIFIYNGIKLSKLWIAKTFDIWNGQISCTRLNETYLKTTLSFPLTIYMDMQIHMVSCLFMLFVKMCIEIIIILNNCYLNYNICMYTKLTCLKP